MRWYPAGGWDDFIGSYDRMWECRVALKKLPPIDHDWHHIVDRDSGEVVKKWCREPPK